MTPPALTEAAPAQGVSEGGNNLIALAGPPNVGKSTVFNLLTGLSQHVGNWPGKTVEQKSGRFRQDGKEWEIVDLPGAYSLSADSLEERIARDFVAQTRPAVVVAMVNAANLERTLYLVAELLELPSPVVVGVNMVDVAQREGFKVEPHVLEAALGVPVVATVGTRGEGLAELMAAAAGVVEGRRDYRPARVDLGEEIETVVSRLTELLATREAEVLPDYPRRWLAVKVLEGDTELTRLLRETLPASLWAKIEQILRPHEDAAVAIAGARYHWITRMVNAALTRPPIGVVSLTERIDHVTTHLVAGPLALLGLLAAIFWLVYQVSTPLVKLLELGLGATTGWLRASLAGWPDWLVGLLADGVLSGVGTVLVLLPVLGIFFLAMGFLEDVGYMARAAFVADRFMHGIGLHGKSFLPLFLGFGCNVPAVLGTRILEEGRARLLTVFLAPFVPCSARLAVLIFFTAAIFGANGPWVMSGLVVFNLVVLALTGLAIHRFVFRGESPAFILEMPLYHVPNWRTIALNTWQRLSTFIARAGTVIVLFSALLWALSYLPSGEIDSSYLAAVGRGLEPLTRLMGLDWQFTVALLSSIVAKEVTVATLAIISTADEAGLAAALPGMLTPAAGLAFLVAQMVFVPCIATIGAIRQETGSWRWPALSFAYHTLAAVVLGIAVYQVALAVGLGG